jgi:hypothetical protein
MQGIVIKDQLVNSEKCKAIGAKGVHEYIPVRIRNTTEKVIHIQKGDIIATAEKLSENVIATIEEYTVEKKIHNYKILAGIFSPNTCGNQGTKNVAPHSTSSHVTQSKTMVKTQKEVCCSSVTHQSNLSDISEDSMQKGEPEKLVPNCMLPKVLVMVEGKARQRTCLLDLYLEEGCTNIPKLW